MDLEIRPCFATTWGLSTKTSCLYSITWREPKREGEVDSETVLGGQKIKRREKRNHIKKRGHHRVKEKRDVKVSVVDVGIKDIVIEN